MATYLRLSVREATMAMMMLQAEAPPQSRTYAAQAPARDYPLQAKCVKKYTTDSSGISV